MCELKSLQVFRSERRMMETSVAQIQFDSFIFAIIETKTMTLFHKKKMEFFRRLKIEPPFFSFRYFHDGMQVAKPYLTSS